jgi:hypothetical protein
MHKGAKLEEKINSKHRQKILQTSQQQKYVYEKSHLERKPSKREKSKE